MALLLRVVLTNLSLDDMAMLGKLTFKKLLVQTNKTTTTTKNKQTGPPSRFVTQQTKLTDKALLLWLKITFL